MLPVAPIMVAPLGLMVRLLVAKAPPASAKNMAPPVAGEAGKVAVTVLLTVLTPYLEPTVAEKFPVCIVKLGSVDVV